MKIQSSSDPMNHTDSQEQLLINSRRQSVKDLPKTEFRIIYIFFALYVISIPFSLPILLGEEWRSNNFFKETGVWFCLIILILPVIGYPVGNALLRRCAQVAIAAEKIDNRTGQLRDNEANLHGKSRDTLFGDYVNHISDNDAILKAVLSDALNRAMVDRWEPASWLVDAQWTALSRGLPLLATLQRIALQLGILFTFIGLTVAFSRFPANTVGRVPDLQPLFEALQVKFVSSIAGLVASISLLALGWVCRRELAHTVMRLETMADNILTLAKLLRNDLKFASDLTLLRRSVETLELNVQGLRDSYNVELKNLKDAVTDVHKNVAGVGENIEGVRNGYRDVISAVNRAGSEFNGSVNSVLDEQRKVVAEIEKFYRQLSPQGLSENLAAVLNDSMGVFSQRLSSAADALAAMHVAIEKLATVERVRADDDMGTTARHRELVNAIRTLSTSAAWGPSGDSKPGDGWLGKMK